MRRRLLVLVLLLVGGAIVNVAVAWGLCLFAYRHDPNGTSRQPIGEELAWWRSIQIPVSPNELSRVRTRSSLGYREKRHAGVDVGITQTDRGPTQFVHHGTWAEAGFPMRTLRGEWFKYYDAASKTWRAESSGAWRLPEGSQRALPNDLFYLPSSPRWLGFAINTVFYAVILWLPFALRKRRRIKRGQCVKCGYDLRNRPSDSSVCPECGTTLR